MYLVRLGKVKLGKVLLRRFLIKDMLYTYCNIICAFNINFDKKNVAIFSDKLTLMDLVLTNLTFLTE